MCIRDRLDPDEVVTHSFVRDIPISGGKTLALITLDNGKDPVSYTHLRAHETVLDLVCRLLLETKK